MTEPQREADRSFEALADAADRASRLQRVTGRLAGALTPQEVLDAILTEGLRAAEARAGTIGSLSEDGEAIELLAQRGYEAPILEEWARFPISADLPMSYVARTAEPLFLESKAERNRLFPNVEESGEDGHALAVLPLGVEGRLLGVIALSFGEDMVFTEERRQMKITLARQAAQALDRARLYEEAEKGANAARALAYVADGVVLLDQDGCVRHWNPAAVTITGITEDEALGRRVEALLQAWGSLVAHVPLVRPGEARGRPVTLPITVEGGELWVSASGVDFGEGTVYALRDVTDEHALERARSDFVATASHELRTPLAAVYGAIRTLRRDDIDLGDNDRAVLLEMIEAESVRLAQIVDQILVAGQLDADAIDLELEPCDPVELAAGVVESAELHLPDGVSLHVKGRSAQPILCDPNKLRQVLSNLVDNAIKYSPDGGDVEIRLASENGATLIEVADEGLGIPTSERERIFEKFYRLDPQQTRGVGGSGLGLYICRELVERMNGSLEVESEPGQGSRFRVSLPAGAA